MLSLTAAVCPNDMISSRLWFVKQLLIGMVNRSPREGPSSRNNRLDRVDTLIQSQPGQKIGDKLMMSQKDDDDDVKEGDNRFLHSPEVAGDTRSFGSIKM